MSVPDMEANGNQPAEWLLFGLFPGEARCRYPTWKRMKMEPIWGILGGGASETRSWRFGAPSPQVKLILVRFPDG
jgi:hypothetical protein